MNLQKLVEMIQTINKTAKNFHIYNDKCHHDYSNNKVWQLEFYKPGNSAWIMEIFVIKRNVEIEREHLIYNSLKSHMINDNDVTKRNTVTVLWGGK